jgi:hypothetical protein
MDAEKTMNWGPPPPELGAGLSTDSMSRVSTASFLEMAIGDERYASDFM